MLPERSKRQRLSRSAAAGVMTVDVKGRQVLDEEAMRQNKTFDKQIQAARVLSEALRNARKAKNAKQTSD